MMGAVGRHFLPIILLLACLVVGLPDRAKAAPGWVNPPPPYPNHAMMHGEVGMVILRVSTDATGRVVKATASVPNRQKENVPAIAQGCVEWALTHWHGPPNAKGKMVMEFRLH